MIVSKSKCYVFSLVLIMMGLISCLVLSPGQAAAATGSDQASTTLVSPFPDLPSSDGNALYVKYLVNKGIISGYSDGNFHPGEGLTRAQAAVVMAKAAGLTVDQNSQSAFSDVNASYWAKGYINAVAKAGYIQGMPDGRYLPEEKLTRAQGISLLLRLSKQNQNVATFPQLTDINSSHWAAKAVATGLASGMVGLSPDGKKYLPEAPFTRIALAHALGLLLTEDSDLYYSELPGTVNPISGSIKIRNSSGQERQITKKTEINIGDKIISGANSSCELLYPDGSSLLVKENTELTIKEARGRKYIKSDGNESIAVDWLNLDLKEGTMLTALAAKHEVQKDEEKNQTLNTGKLRYKDDYLVASLGDLNLAAANTNPEWWKVSSTKKVKVKVDMPWGVASVRGTFIMFNVSHSGQANISCLTGDAEVSNNGVNVPLGQGQGTAINAPSSAPSPSTSLDASAVQQFVQEQNWIQQTARIMDEVQEASLPPAPQATLTYQETPAGTLAPATANTPGLSPGTILQNQTALETVNRAIEESTGNVHSTNTPSSSTNTPTTSNGGGGGGGGGGDSSAIIRSVSDLMDTVVEGDPYQLPVSVTATMSNGTTRQVPVNWSSGNPDTAVAGIVQISGTVTGYASPVRLILAVGKRFGVPAAITAGQPVIIEGGISIDLGTMSIPEGATVTVQEVTAPDFGTSGMQAAGKIIDINFSNIVIDQPVQISLPLNPGVDPNKSAIYLYDNGNWEYQPSQFLNGSIVATVTHFSIYGVLLDQSPPENVNVSKGNVSSGSVELLLSARDSSGEIEYQIYRDGELLATTTDTSYVDQGLESGNEYHYQVKAIDRFDNISDFSPTLDVTVIGNNTDLSGLSISPGTISPVFAKDNLSYTASVSCEVESVTVTATAADEKSSLTINGSEVSPGENGSATINLEKGENVITIIVKAEDETSTKTYTLVITRASNNYADLSGLSINPGTINPVFEKDTLNYTASVSREVESIAITAISTDEKASVTINGSPAAGGDSTIDLEKGENTITIIVNAEDGVTSRTYTLVITRAGSDNADLAGITISSGTISPVFDKDVLNYTSSAGKEVEQITLSWTLAEPAASVKVNGSSAGGTTSMPITLNTGENIVTIEVTAEDGTTIKSYTLTVNKSAKNNNAYLSSLSTSAGGYSPGFSKEQANYSSTVPYYIGSISINAVPEDSLATVSINGNPGTSSTVNLNEGANSLNIRITAEDGSTTRDYSLTVTREAAPPPPPPVATADVVFALTTPAAGDGNSISGGGATRTVVVSVVNNTSPVVITGTKTAAQTVTIGGTDAALVAAGGTDTAPTYEVNTDIIKAAGGGKTFSLTISESGKTNIVYTVTVNVQALTADVAFDLTDPEKDSSNTISGGGATKTITINVENNTKFVTLTGMKTTTQTIAIGGINAAAVTASGTGTAPTYIVDTENIAAVGGSKTFTLTVSEIGKTSIVYTVNVAVSAPLQTTGDVAFALTTPAPGGGNSISGGGATRTVAVSAVNNTGSVIITGTKTAAQTVTIGGTDAALAVADGTNTAPTYEVNTDSIKAAGGSKTFTLTISETGKTSIVYAITVTVAAVSQQATGDVAFALTTPTVGDGNSISGGGATRTVSVSVVNNTDAVVITGTKTAAQTVALGGTDAALVAANGTDTDPTYEVNTDSIKADGGSKTFTLTIDEAGKTSIVYTVTIIVAAPTSGNIDGYICHAVDNSHVSGIIISFRPGSNNTSGTPVATVTTDSNGYYKVEGLAAGTYTGQTSGTGFSSTTLTVTCVANTTTTAPICVITPILPDGVTRIVLTWGSSPQDMDSYLSGPSATGRFKVFYRKKNHQYLNKTYVELDRDDRDGYGPETTTIYQQLNGDYILSVNRYSNDGDIYSSGAQVKVYRGSDVVATFDAPTDVNTGKWWTVFKMNGNTITPINYISNSFEATSTTNENQNYSIALESFSKDKM